MRNLTIAPNWVGDTVLAIPVFDALAASDRSVVLLCKPHLQPLISLIPSVASVIERSDSDKESIESIRKGRFDEAVILPNSLRSVLLASRAGVDRRWGYRSRSPEGVVRGFFLDPAVARPDLSQRNQVEDYSELLARMGVEEPQDWTPRIELSADGIRDGQALLSRAQIRPGSAPVIGLFAGAEFGPSKRWPWKRFVELSRKIRSARPEVQQVIIAGPKEVWLAVRIHEETGKIHPVIGPDLDLGRLANALAQLDLMITNDSGPMHLAAALGVPCLALFGPTNPTRTRPYGPQHRVMYTERWCSPCFRRRCPLIHHGCMRDLQVDNITEQALEMLAES